MGEGKQNPPFGSTVSFPMLEDNMGCTNPRKTSVQLCEYVSSHQNKEVPNVVWKKVCGMQHFLLVPSVPVSNPEWRAFHTKAIGVNTDTHWKTPAFVFPHCPVSAVQKHGTLANAATTTQRTYSIAASLDVKRPQITSPRKAKFRNSNSERRCLFQKATAEKKKLVRNTKWSNFFQFLLFKLHPSLFWIQRKSFFSFSPFVFIHFCSLSITTETCVKHKTAIFFSFLLFIYGNCNQMYKQDCFKNAFSEQLK